MAVVSALRWAVMAPAFVLGLSTLFRPVHPSFGGMAQLAFLVAILVSVITSQDTYLSTVIFARILCPFALARSASLLNTPQKHKLVNAIVWTISFFVISSALVSGIHNDIFYPGGVSEVAGARIRLSGMTFHPNVLGYCAAFIICVSLFKVIFEKYEIVFRLFWLGLLAVALTVLHMTDSRTGVLATVVGVTVLLSMRYFAKAYRSGGIVPVILALVTGLALLSPLALALGYLSAGDAAAKYEGSNLARLTLWNTGWDFFMTYPVTGRGLGTTVDVTVAAGKGETGLPYFHSVLINYMATCGVIGAASVLWMIFETLYRVITFSNPFLISDPRFQRQEDILLFCKAAMVVTLVFAITEGALQGIYPTYLLFALSIGLLPRIATQPTTGGVGRVRPPIASPPTQRRASA